MIIAQITDLHLVPKGQLCQGRVPTCAQLREAVAHINGLEPRPDVVLVTGDLTDHGTLEEYDAVRSVLSSLRPPFYVIPGNHDRRDVLLEAFSDHPYLPRPGSPFAHYVIDEFPVRFVALDTTCIGEHQGLLCDQRLAWAEATLRASNRPTLIFMHHPPFRTGIRWVDAIGLHGGRRLQDLVARHTGVERVLCGHIHRPIQVNWGGAIATTAPSSSHAQVALALTEANGFNFDYALEPRAIQLFVWDPGYGWVSHFSYISDVTATFRSVNAPKLREDFRRRYDELSRTEFDVDGSIQSWRRTT